MNSKGDYFNLNDRVMVVTGATGILGESFIEGLKQSGAKIALLGRNEEIGRARMESLNALGGDTLFIKADVLNKGDLEAARVAILQKWGRIDGLVNAAGGNIPEAVIAP